MRKSLFILTILSATLAAALCGCQREVLGPDNGKSVDEVITSFVFNVSTGASKTKQTATDTQAAGDNFRGIVDTRLMVYFNKGDNWDGAILPVDEDAHKVYDLSRFAENDRISSTLSRRVLEMSLPLKTNIMLLYGRAGYPTTYVVPEGLKKEDKFGGLAKDNGYHVTNEAGLTDFALRQRLEDVDRYYTTEKLLAGILTVIMNTGLEDADDDGKADDPILASEKDNTDNAYGFNIAANTKPAVKWCAYANATNSPFETDHPLYPLEEQLQHVYQQMTTIKSDQGELRAAAGEDILRVISDLWSNVNAVRCASPISEAEAMAKHLAVHIHAHLGQYFVAKSGVPSDGSAVGECTFEGITTLISQINSDVAWPIDSEDESGYRPATTAIAKLGGDNPVNPALFPSNFDMPRGVSYMAFDTGKKCFYYPQEFNTSAVSGDPSDPDEEQNPTSGVPYDARSYFYPAEILYFGNSPVRTSDLEHKTADYPGTSEKPWDAKSSWPQKTGDVDDWSGSHVVSSTRSVAMKYSINYGVAMLESRVDWKDGLSSLNDNNHAIQAANAGYPNVDAYDAAGHSNDEPDKIIPIDDNSFKFTGIIIGGQSAHIGWDFLPQKENSEDAIIKTGFIYDRAIANQNVPTPENGQNYTVVFDNFNKAAHENNKPQDKVFVALEFQNNTGSDFYGNCNLIRNGGYFYLIAALDPNDNSAAAISWPTSTVDKEISHIVPPYEVYEYKLYEGTSEEKTMKGVRSLEIPRVFVQDFVTKATFKFGQNSLKYAYLTVPDLRSSSVTIGLSVDIEWGDGLVYEDVLLGGE